MTIKFSDITGGGIPYGNNAGRPVNPGIGKLYSNGEEKRLELFTNTGWQNIVSETPGVVSVSGNYNESIGSATLEITGTNFSTGAIASAIGTNGVEVNANSTTVNSIVSINANFSGLSPAYEPYDIKVTNTSNLFGLLPDSLYINNSPVWQTASGSLGTFGDSVSVSVSATASDTDSTISYALASGSSLPSGLSLNSSTGAITGNLPAVTSNTTYTFTINATDGSNTVPRTFSITETDEIDAEILIAAGGGGAGYDVGGGGGGGGLIDKTMRLLKSQSYSISSIGQGGASADSVNGFVAGNSGSNTTALGLTAIGGGGGGYYGAPSSVKSGGSGGGAGLSYAGGEALQPSSASGGFGYNGGSAGGAYGSGGGGGAGGPGGDGSPGIQTPGGLPRYSSITGSSVAYSGGGYGNPDGGAVNQTGYNIANSLVGYYGFGANGTGIPNANPNGGNPGVVIIAYPNTYGPLTISGGLVYDQPTRAGYRVYRFTSGSGTIVTPS